MVLGGEKQKNEIEYIMGSDKSKRNLVKSIEIGLYLPLIN